MCDSNKEGATGTDRQPQQIRIIIADRLMSPSRKQLLTFKRQRSVVLSSLKGRRSSIFLAERHSRTAMKRKRRKKTSHLPDEPSENQQRRPNPCGGTLLCWLEEHHYALVISLEKNWLVCLV